MIDFDWKNPDYTAIYRLRAERLARIRAASAKELIALKGYYRANIPDFISEWGMTYDPRLARRDIPPVVPFLLFPRQREWVEWTIGHWRAGTPGLSDKSRDIGFSWLAVSTGCALSIFFDGVTIGFGSRLEDLVDQTGDIKSLFEKARFFMEKLPVEFRAGWVRKRDAPYMRMFFPETGSAFTGEAGKNIGRGGRTSIFFLDEASYIEKPQSVEGALSQNTDCQIDFGSANGMGNLFAEKRFSGRVDVFTFSWRDDPRKDQAWYEKEKARLDPIILAQEVDIDYHASLEGQLIPSEWVQASVDAHLKLNFKPSGERRAALDVADEGRDLNALVASSGPLVTHLAEWTGKGSDILYTVERAFALCDEWECPGFDFDADGLGAGVRGDARIFNEQRKVAKRPAINVQAFRGSGEVLDSEGQDLRGRTNADMFLNRKAQAWWRLRERFRLTHHALAGGPVASHDDLISLSSKLPKLTKLTGELAQIAYKQNAVGKLLVDKQPDGVRSPNLADALMIRFSGGSRPPMLVTDAALKRQRQMAMARRAA